MEFAALEALEVFRPSTPAAHSDATAQFDTTKSTGPALSVRLGSATDANAQRV